MADISNTVPATAAPGQITTRICLTIQCAHCPPDETPMHFDSEAELVGWIEGENWAVNGSGLLICDDHARRARCEREGHEWLPWAETALFSLRVRTCHRCPETDYRDIDIEPALQLDPSPLVQH